jgi:cell division protein FtsL
LGGLSSWQRALATRPTSQLLRFLLVLLLLCGLTCLYLWQASTVTDIQQHISELNLESAEYERANVTLMLQVARWYSPEYVIREATAQGMHPNVNPVFVTVAEDGQGSPVFLP